MNQITELELEALLAKYRLQLKDRRFSDYGRDQARETVSALEELKFLRRSASVPLEGIVE
jgi:hypothetical protein